MKKVVVIGGGLGGLASALTLSAQGHKVTLIERFARVGGYATTWKRDGVNIEGVLHEIDDMGLNSDKYALLKELGVEGVEYVPTPEFYRVIAKDLDFTLPHENAKEALIEKFKDEKENIEKYFATLKNISGEIMSLMRSSILTYFKMALFPLFFPNIVKYEKSNVEDFLNLFFTNESLKIAVAANIGYYTDDPKNLSTIFFAIAQQSYYDGGGWFVKGGSQNLSDAFAIAIRKNGGEVITSAEVTRILTKNGKACAIKYTHKNKTATLDCDYILNNASPIWALEALDDKSAVKNSNVWTEAQKSPSSFVVYAILRGQKSQNSKYSTFVFNDSASIREIKDLAYATFDARTFSVADYGAIDSGLTNEDKRLITITAIDRYDDWVKDGTYNAKKDAAAKILLERASQIYPDIKTDLISYEVATPLTNERYTHNSKGAIYGYAQTINQSGRFRKKFAKILPNIINASAWGEIGGGYSGAIYGGFIAAKHIK